MAAAMIAAVAIPAAIAAYQDYKNRGEREKAESIRQDALSKYGEDIAGSLPQYDTSLPSVPQAEGYDPLDYATADYGGISYDPITGEAVQMGPSALTDISLDPEARKAQLAALSKLQGLGETGMDATDEARMAQIQERTGMQARGAREAVMQNMAERGLRGSGMELAAQLSANQAAASQSRQEGLGVQAMAQQRALEAMMASGQLGGQMRGQDFQEQARIAQAQDAIAQFNAQQQAQQQAANLGTMNQSKMIQYQQQIAAAKEAAEAQNLSGLSRIDADKYGNQIDQTNYMNQLAQQQYLNDLKSQDFQNKMSAATGQMGADTQSAANTLAELDQKQQKATTLASGTAQGVTAYADYKQKQDELDWKKQQAQQQQQQQQGRPIGG